MCKGCRLRAQPRAGLELEENESWVTGGEGALPVTGGGDSGTSAIVICAAGQGTHRWSACQRLATLLQQQLWTWVMPGHQALVIVLWICSTRSPTPWVRSQAWVCCPPPQP